MVTSLSAPGADSRPLLGTIAGTAIEGIPPGTALGGINGRGEEAWGGNRLRAYAVIWNGKQQRMVGRSCVVMRRCALTPVKPYKFVKNRLELILKQHNFKIYGFCYQE